VQRGDLSAPTTIAVHESMGSVDEGLGREGHDGIDP
jgi:hypothetical protein